MFKYQAKIKVLLFSVVLFGVWFSVASAAGYSDTYTAIFDASGPASYQRLDWNVTTDASSSMVLEVRASDNATLADNPPWQSIPSGTQTNFSGSVTSNLSGVAIQGKRYLQYRSTLSLLDDTATSSQPMLNSVNIYLNQGVFESSVFNSNSFANGLQAFAWNANTPGNSEIRYQFRSSMDKVTWSPWCGPDDGTLGGFSSASCATTTWFVANSSSLGPLSQLAGNANYKLDADLANDNNDIYFQYKALLFADPATPANRPTISTTSLGYSWDYYSGTVISSSTDGGMRPFHYLNAVWTASTTVGANWIELSLRAGDSASTTDGTWTQWQSTTTIATSSNGIFTQDLTQFASTTDGHRYFQYQAKLVTSDTNNFPVLHKVDINTYTYNPGWLISNWYDSADISAELGAVGWNATGSTTGSHSYQVRLQARTASSSNNAPMFVDGYTDTDWFGPDGATSTMFESGSSYCQGDDQVNCNIDESSNLTPHLSVGADDQFVQYKVYLETDGYNAPVLQQVKLDYAINIAPVASSTTTGVHQGLPGELVNIAGNSLDLSNKALIGFSVYDPDTFATSTTGQLSAKTPGRVDVLVQYCTAADCTTSIQSGWSYAASTTYSIYDQSGVEIGATTTVGVSDSPTDPASFTVVFSPASYLADIEQSNFRFRVVIDDSEGANRFSYITSDPFAVDYQGPRVVMPIINGSQIPANIVSTSTDLSEVRYKIGFQSDLVDVTSWSTATTSGLFSASLNLTKDPDTVYVQAIDNYNNLSAIVSVSTPESPKNLTLADISNQGAGIFKEFLSWKVVTTPVIDFKQYNIWRSIDGTNFSLYHTITDKTVNFFLDDEGGTNLDPGTTYTYKLTAEDVYGNISRFDKILADAPDGTSLDTTAPIISAVLSGTTTSQTAEVTWNTNEPTDSAVVYATDIAQVVSGVQAGISSLADLPVNLGGHKVVVSGLLASTTYYYQVKSTDIAGNTAIDDNGGSYYQFTTMPGAQISNVEIKNLKINSATITWNTDLPANSTVVYSTDNSFSTSTPLTGETDLVLLHTVNLSDLTPATGYYFYLQSVDAENNTAIGLNTASGTAEYFYFRTSSDQMGPTFSAPLCQKVNDNELLITATSSEPAISLGYYGSTSKLAIADYSSQTATSTGYNTDHAFSLTGLVASTTYYFRLVGIDEAGNQTITGESSCNTEETLITKTEADKLVASSTEEMIPASQKEIHTGTVYTSPPGGGGGVIITGKTDKLAPVISALVITDIASSGARVRWVTDEDADGFVDYGIGVSDRQAGSRSKVKRHEINLQDLKPDSKYGFYVTSVDDAGNLASSSLQYFSTSKSTTPEFDASTRDDLLKQIADLKKEQTKNDETLSDKDASLEIATKKIIDLLNTLAGQVSLGVLEKNLLSQYDALDSLAKLIPAPILNGEPVVEVGATQATIKWTSNKEASSLVAFADEAVFSLNKNKDDRYDHVEGEPYKYLTSHQVTISNLKPDILYHYQVRSKAKVGPLSISKDFSFRTKKDALEIQTYTVDIINPQTAEFKWLTNYPANSIIKFTPYRGDRLAVEETKTILDKALTTDHLIKIAELEAGVPYQIELIGIDRSGIQTTKQLPNFTTTNDDLAPEINQVQTQSALQQGKSTQVQTIITWLTSEPTIGQIEYEQGVLPSKEKFLEITPVDNNYGKRHTAIITKFKPGEVYSFRVHATDSTGNETVSKTYTLLTPKQKQGVFELIMNTLNDTFGWLGQMK